MKMRNLLHTLAALCAAAWLVPAAHAADACTNRGELDTMYCDANKDMVADTPTDAKKWKNPSTIVFTYTPVEDPAVYENVFKPFTDYLAKCTAKRVVYFPVQSNSAEIEAMRSGRLHVAGFSTGPTGFAVNMAGAIPFAAKGTADQYRGYHLAMVVKADSPYKTLADLKGKKVAHTAASSNSGNLAPRALFPAEGLMPDRDYKPLFSGKHEHSIAGVAAGDYDAAPIAHDILERMAERGTVKMDDFRIIWKSRNFPPGGLSMAHDLAPALAAKIRECTHAFRYTPEMQKGFQGADRWLPIDYKRDWAIVRDVAQASGQSFTREAFEREKARAEAAKKK